MVAEKKGKCLGPEKSRNLGFYSVPRQCQFDCAKKRQPPPAPANVGGCQHKENGDCIALFGKVLEVDGDTGYTCWTYEWPGNRYFPNF